MKDFEFRFWYGESYLAIHPFDWYIKPFTDVLLHKKYRYFLCFTLLIEEKQEDHYA